MESTSSSCVEGGRGLAQGAYPTLLLPLDTAFRSIGVGRTKGYELIASGHLTLVKIGAKSLITVDSVLGFVDGLRQAAVRERG